MPGGVGRRLRRFVTTYSLRGRLRSAVSATERDLGTGDLCYAHRCDIGQATPAVSCHPHPTGSKAPLIQGSLGYWALFAIALCGSKIPFIQQWALFVCHIYVQRTAVHLALSATLLPSPSPAVQYCKSALL